MNDGGSMMTLTYNGSMRVMPNYNVMGVAKAGLEASVRYLATDYGPRGIRVNAISAGPIRTLAGAGISDARHIFSCQQRNSPLRTTVTIEEVGGSALYLLSDLSSGVTGEIHYVDSGYNIISMPTLESSSRATAAARLKPCHCLPATIDLEVAVLGRTLAELGGAVSASAHARRAGGDWRPEQTAAAFQRCQRLPDHRLAKRRFGGAARWKGGFMTIAGRSLSLTGSAARSCQKKCRLAPRGFSARLALAASSDAMIGLVEIDPLHRRKALRQSPQAR